MKRVVGLWDKVNLEHLKQRAKQYCERLETGIYLLG